MGKRRRRAGLGKRAQFVLEYGLLRGALFGLACLPRPAALWVARRLGDFAFDFLRLRRRVTFENLRLALGSEFPARELKRVARGSYRAMGMTFIELTLFGKRGLGHLARSVRFSGAEHAAAAAALNRGVIYLTAHVGNWEICAASVALVDAPITVVIAEQRNPYVDRLVRRSREQMDLTLAPAGYALRGLLRTLRARGRVGLAGDQDAGPEGIAIPFMGRPASTAVGPARMAYRTGAPIVIGLDRHVGRGEHLVEYYPALIADPRRPEEDEVRRILTEYMRRLEDFVRRHPEQYFWMHRRWKTVLPAAGEGAACAG
jgi:KDO2-lipid IV(A) lauroyltransferase